ncbi:lysine 2,3-aminomutase [Methylonatrum kenyense]|uniref:KamA family radical SAM protein n=1 Tax=Methylonatrum kenyense TaxID=455253 RepID=UPI0020C1487D|nr:lysine 2,3-aminomutase [Methylonatrum kenyense]
MSSTLPLRHQASTNDFSGRRFQVFTARNLARIPGVSHLPESQRFAMQVVASVLPFRVNDYVVEELIDWDRVPDDPIFQLVFPQRDMLAPESFSRMAEAIRRDRDRGEIQQLARDIRGTLNPHPAGQMELNVPQHQGEAVEGMQHKYRETVLFFPSQGQVCHSYCTFCFRWAQFVGDKELRFASNEADSLLDYLRSHPEVSDLLMTGGDPMVMKTRNLAQYLEPLLKPGLEHVQTVRIGTKALTFWPYRFVTDKDADELLRLLERLVASGRHVAIMAHYNHPQEISTAIAEEAIRRLRDTGAEIRSQGPLLNHINNDPADWAALWRKQVRLGIIPYYMFVERDTGARRYFEVPLARAWEVYRQAMKQVSGLGRTARGPSMSADPGKVEIQGVTEIHGEKVFVLRFIQGRNPDWVQRPFFARFDPEATWLNQLRPAFGDKEFFYEAEYREMLNQA